MEGKREILDRSFWNNRWENHQTGWDIGYPSPAIVEYIEKKTNKNAAILIPGCGNAHEAEYLCQKGFTDITLVDIAPKAVEILGEKFKNQPSVKVFCADFFDFEGSFDLMVEQTFFCTHYLWRREEYAEKAASLLKENGTIAGLLFASEFDSEGPPFGGTEAVYRQIFEKDFVIKTMEICQNSIPPRADNELFIELIKKKI